MTINFTTLTTDGLASADARRKELAAEIGAVDGHMQTLRRALAGGNKPSITYDPLSAYDEAFSVYIPPFRLEHFGDEGSPQAPFGTTYFAAWEEASKFLALVLAEIETGVYS